MLRRRDISMPINYSASELKKKTARELGVAESDIVSVTLAKRSIDARRKNNIHYICSVDVKLSAGENAVLSKCADGKTTIAPYTDYAPPVANDRDKRVVIAGFGPAGMFASLVLAEAGLRPIVVERGSNVDTRSKKVTEFRETGRLDPECNVQFGEGGAGAFSDGKLNTGIKNERISYILKTFVRFGAHDDIMYDARPHVGTDVLVNVVREIRNHVISLGAEVLTDTKLTGYSEKDGTITGVTVISNGIERDIPCDALILATGHSARDVFELLENRSVSMERKAFSMGVRIEHPQTLVNDSQYGPDWRALGLPPADYRLNAAFPDGSSAYTFCMCPGGQVMAAASEENGVATNGMSLYARDFENANSALLVTLRPEDMPYEGTLAGIRWQREIEQRAFVEGGSNYFAPAQLVGDFLKGVPSRGCGSVSPSYKPGVRYTDLRRVLPEKITGTLKLALPALDRKLRGFAMNNAVMTAPETRSSSPVRIVRDEKGESVTLKGLYPAGEGAGYAGGIVSAAVDGMLQAEAVLTK